ncbi:hypothetical protein HZH68_010208 [Vespula germanica]|uniref:Uncharacterized protein n=1 Tax=Vespula germanica TaxID=30212 RepID=A0A834JUW2_VESGE|nr:hypothetical protein HZH68_010208 [Vespula germanica]
MFSERSERVSGGGRLVDGPGPGVGSYSVVHERALKSNGLGTAIDGIANSDGSPVVAIISRQLNRDETPTRAYESREYSTLG